jgi:ABC-2 type transport system permease protein
MRTIWLLCSKDLRVWLRDRAAVLSALAIPIVLVLIFGSAMGAMGGEESIGRVELLVLDRDRTPDSRRIVDALRDSKSLELEEREDAAERVAKGREPAALVIDAGFAAGTGKLRLLRDPSKEIEQQIVLASLAPALFEARGQELAKQLTLASLDWFEVPSEFHPEAREVIEDTWVRMAAIAMRAGWSRTGADVSETAEAKAGDAAGSGFEFARDLPKALGLEVEDVAGDSGRGNKIAAQAHAVAGIAVMMLLFGLSACGGTLLEERAAGTLERVLCAPGTHDAILIAKLLFTMISGMLQLIVLFAFGALVFSLPVFDAPLALAATSFCTALAATGFGVLLAVLCRSRKQLEGLSVLLILTMSALGGSWFPLVIAPEWFRKLGHFTLNAWAMDAYQGIFWYGKGLDGILLELGVLSAIGLGAIGLASALWRRANRQA